jgi:hypothetical protein
MSTKMKVCRIAVAILFTVAISYPFRIGAKTATAALRQDSALAPQAGVAKTGLVAGKGLKDRRILPPSAIRSKRPAPKVSPQATVIPPCVGSVLTGTGACVSDESQNQGLAENVAMPTNLGGTMVLSGEVDAYAFTAFANQQVTVDAFSGRIGSDMTAEIVLLASDGETVLGEAEEDEFGDDPFIQYTASSRTTLFAVIEDAFGFSGSDIFYILNIEQGQEISPASEPDVTPDALPALDVSSFSTINGSNDVDMYTFTGTQGMTLIAAVEASVYGGTLISQLQLIDPSNNVIYFTNSHTDGDDPRFNIVLPYTGEYLMTITPLSGTSGEYDFNLSQVPSTAGPGAPSISSASHNKPKLIQVSGTQLGNESTVEADSLGRPTSRIKKNLLQGHVTGGAGTVITVRNSPDGRRSNPFILQ